MLNYKKNSVDRRKNSLYKPRTAIFLIVLMLTLTQIMLASAFTFDNVKDYDETTKTLSVNDCSVWAGTCLVTGNKIIEWKRTTPNPNLVIQSASTDKKDWRPVVCYENLYLDYDLKKEELFTGQELINQKTKENFNRDYEWRVAYQVPYQVPKMVLDKCIDTDYNKTIDGYNQDCSYKQDGTITKYRTQYKVVNDLSDIRLNDEICLFTYVGAGDWGEQIPSFAGRSFPEDSEWNSSIEVDLISYYKLDADAIDSLGINNGTVTGGSFVSAHINNGWDTGDLESNEVDLNDALIPLSGDFSISFWASRDDADHHAYFIGQHAGGAGRFVFYINSDDKTYVSVGGSNVASSTGTITDTDYHHYVATRSGNTFQIYIDGSPDGSGSSSTSLENTNTLIGALASGSYMAGIMDEVGFWNRALTADEVTQLYNGGAGITYTPAVAGDPIVNLWNPAANAKYSTSPKEIEFNCTAEDETTIQNVTLYINGLANYTITNGATNYTNLIRNITFEDGSYNWTCKAYDNSGGLGENSTRLFYVDSTPPTISITSLGAVNYHKKYDNLTINYSISDTNIDTCLMEYEGINNTLNCSASGTYINISSADNRQVIIFSNDTFGNSNSSSMSWTTYNVFENSRTFTASTTETATEEYIINITLGSGVSLSSANLIWNSTTYGSDISASGTGRIVSNEIIIPSVSGQINKTFYWSFNTNAGVINSSSSNQTIKELAFDDCSSYSNLILNYSIYDEDSRTFLNNDTWNVSSDIYVKLGADFSGVSYKEYSSEITKNPVQLCTQNAIGAGENYRLDSVVQYSASSHVSEYHYIENYTLNASVAPRNVGLYLLSTNNSQEFLITYKDSNFIPKANAIIDITRQYLDLGQFLSVEVIKTDTDGKTIGHFVLNDEVYTIYVRVNNQLVAVYENVRAFCSNILTGDCQISLNEASSTSNPDSFTSRAGVTGTESYDDDTKIFTFDFTTTDNTPKIINVSIYKYAANPIEVMCSEQISSSSGSLTCTIPAAYYNNTAIAKILVDGDLFSTNIFHVSISKKSEQNPTRFILAFLLVITIPFLAFTSGPMTLILFILGLILAGGLFLIDFGGFIGAFSAFLWFIIAAIILLIKASKRRQQ